MPEIRPTDRLAYRPSEAAEILGCSRQTVHALINRGQLRRYKVGRLTRIPAADVHALVGYEEPSDGEAIQFDQDDSAEFRRVVAGTSTRLKPIEPTQCVEAVMTHGSSDTK